MTPAVALLVVAAAGPPQTIRLELADCVARPALVTDLVRIELGAVQLVPADADLEVHTACEPERLRVFVVRPTPKTRAAVVAMAERRIPLRDVQGEGGPRLVALNIAELVQDAPPTSPRPAAPPVPARLIEPVPPSLRLRLGAAPTVRLVPSPDRAVPGARVSLALDAAPDAAVPWSLAVDAGFELNTHTLEPGRVHTRVASFAARAGLGWWLLKRLALFVHAGVRGGWVWLSGASEEDEVVTASGDGVWFGPMGSALLRYGDALGVGLGVEGGWTASGVFGDATGTRFGLERGWFGAELRLDWRFGG